MVSERRELQREFPRKTVAAGFRVIRAHKWTNLPWYFGCAGTGRFDLASPRGTCYVASDPLGALAESLGDTGQVVGGVRLISATEIESRCIRVLSLPREVLAADFTSPRAENFGVSRAASFAERRDVSQRLAADLYGARFGAILYETRRRRGAFSLALFGAAGARSRRPWLPGDARAVTAREIEKLRTEFGILVKPVPSSGELAPFVLK